MTLTHDSRLTLYHAGIFVDLRVDLPAVSVTSSKSFGGTIAVEDEGAGCLLTWTREIDYRPLSPPDVGLVAFVGGNTLREDGVLAGDDFSETWERDCRCAAETCVAVELTADAAGGRKGYFVVVGDWFGLSVSRGDIADSDGAADGSADSTAGVSARQLAECFDQPLPEGGRGAAVGDAMLMHVCAMGKRTPSPAGQGQGQDWQWTILHALDQDMVGRSLLDGASANLASLFSDFEWCVVEGAVPADITRHVARGRCPPVRVCVCCRCCAVVYLRAFTYLTVL
jgi:hypothetical protein